jgi:hypothetical protein
MDDSDDELPSLDSLFPTTLRRSSRLKSSTSGRTSPTNQKSNQPSKPSKSPEFSFTKLLKEQEEMRKRQEERAKLASLLAEDMDEFVMDEEDSILNETTEKVLGKGSNDKIKDALSRIGGDLSKEGGYRFFRHVAKERKFDAAWIKDVEWLKGFEGLSSLCASKLIADEETRNGLIECGFVKDMMALKERLPVEVVLWCFEHGIVICFRNR